MKRRDFIKASTLASGVFFVPNFVKSCQSLLENTLDNKKLVLIQLSGGNDGLNTIVPFQNDIYYKNRANLSIKQDKVLKLTDSLGLNENLRGLNNLYDNGNLSIINNVGYPNPIRSHFRSSEIWHTASDSNKILTTGWMGRVLDDMGKLPYSGLEIGDRLSLILKGQNVNGIATKNAKAFYNNMETPYFKQILKYQKNEHLSEHNLGYLYKTMIDSQSSAKYMYETTKTYKSKIEYPKNKYSKQLKTTAEFINSGIDTKLYYISMDGFDTHVNQKNTQNRLLNHFSESVSIFVDDLKKNDTFKDTLILVFSEFGRRLKQNDSNGTDHGAANNAFIIGENLKKSGFYNDGPNLLDLDSNQDIKYSVDFRSIYATILEKWLSINHYSIIKNKYELLDFI